LIELLGDRQQFQAEAGMLLTFSKEKEFPLSHHVYNGYEHSGFTALALCWLFQQKNAY